MKQFSVNKTKKFVAALPYQGCPVDVIPSEEGKLDIRTGNYSDGLSLVPSWGPEGYYSSDEEITDFLKRIERQGYPVRW